ncbi:Arginase/deacetylase [Apiospora sp. TS-2023a]
MATPNRSPAPQLDIAAANKPPRRSDVDAALAQSMQGFSLNSPGTPHAYAKPSPRQNGPLPYPNHPSLPTQDRANLGVSPNGGRNGSRSPVGRSVSNNVTPSRSGTPNLLRKSSSTSLRSTNGITPTRAPSRAASRQGRRGSAASLASPVPRSPTNLPVMEEPKPKPRATENSIANTYFQSELDMLHNSDAAKKSDTLVVLHDSCYGHRFSRPKTTKGNLATIVERPERLQACALGVALAYVRLGERHCEGKISITPDLDPATLATIPFRIRKTDRAISLTSPIVTNVHGTKWMEELGMLCHAAEEQLASGNSELKRPTMDRGIVGGVRGRIGRRMRSRRRRLDIAGFCWLNNVHVGIMHGFMNHGLTHAAIIDIDLHHGDGSQAIAWDHNTRRIKQPKNAAAWKKSSIGYFSLHDINSYPCEAGDIDNIKNASLCIDNAHGQNVWNVHLQEWSSEVEFWRLYQSKYSVLLEKTRNYLRRETDRLRAAGQVPKAAIFISAGFDASEWEGAGMQRHTVNVPTEFYARITRDVVKLSAEEGLSVDGRVISALEGGYSDRALCSGVLSHISGLAGTDAKNAKEESPSRIGRDISRRISVFSSSSPMNSSPLSRRSTVSSDCDAVLPDPRIPKQQGPIPTYCSPTQSSVLKAVDPDKVRRTASGYIIPPPPPPREPTPPPPEVHWPVAAVELSKLLIPTDRPVNSVTWEEMKADSNRIKRDRLSISVQNAESTENNGGVRKSLRERKTVSRASSPTGSVSEVGHRRRRTMTNASSIIQEKNSARGIPSHATSQSRPSTGRRLSSASTFITNSDDSLDPASMMAPPFYPRPDTSQSIRPESSMSSRTNITLDVKKTRPANPRSQSVADVPKRAPKAASTTGRPPGRPKSRASKKKPGLESGEPSPALPPDVVAAHSASSNVAPPVTTSPQSQAPTQASSVSPSRSGRDSDDEVSRLTHGVKKITLVTKEMREAREAAKKSQTSSPTTIKAKPPTRKVRPSDIKTEQEGVIADNSKSADPLTSTLSNPQRAQLQSTSAQHPPSNGMSLPDVSPASMPTTPSIEINQGTVSPSSERGEDLFVPYQPEGSTPKALPQTGPLKWLPPNQAETPKVTEKGHHFTAKSAIPFADSPTREKHDASNGRLAQTPIKAEKQEGSVWEIPETPDCN